MLGARSEDKLQALAEELGGDEHALAVRCDVTSWDDQQALVQAALDRYGRMDSYFANAGFGAARGFLEESVEHWKSMIDTNVLGAALSIRASLGGAGDFYRVRVGVGRPPGRQDPADFLLSNFPAGARESVALEVDRAADAVESLVSVGLERTQNLFNS